MLNTPFSKKNYQDGFHYYKSLKRKKIIITSGYFSRLVEKLIIEKKINNTSIIDLFNFKKLNLKKLHSILKNYNKLIIYDENTNSGGFSFIINNLIIKKRLKFENITNICSPERQIFIYRQDRNDLLKDLKIDINSLHQQLIKI